MNNRILFGLKSTLFFVFLFPMFGLAQTAPATPVEKPLPLKFNEKTHDFGELEYGAPCEFTFEFENTSMEPIALKGVKASCGCTTPKWTREEIAPGESGEIKVTYNSKRVGPFNKSIRVTYDSSATPMVIYIKGKVGPKPVEEGPAVAPQNKAISPALDNTNPVQPPSLVNPKVAPKPPKPAPKLRTEIDLDAKMMREYSIKRGMLRFSKVYQNLLTIKHDETRVVDFPFINTSVKTIKIQDNTISDDAVTVNVGNNNLKTGEKGKITLTLDASKINKEGYFTQTVKIFTDEAAPNNMKELTLSGQIEKKPEPVVVEATKAVAGTPTISFEETSIDGGKLIEGEKFVYDFKFTNTGTSDLIINSAKASCGCTATTPPVEAIKPGESNVITATFNSKGRKGKQSKSITVKSNDPMTPTKVLRFSVEVESDPFHAGNLGPTNAPNK